MIRLFDVLLSLLGLMILLPLFLILALWIKLDSKGPVFYLQKRVGLNNKDFKLVKFRSMQTEADKIGLLTIGRNDQRITYFGAFIRKYKFDELPQLFNVLKGEMSIVGPRPEVRKYTEMYTQEQKIVLTIRPGITDWASIKFRHENEILGKSLDPEKTYINEVIPQKIKLNQTYMQNRSVIHYFKIIYFTMFSSLKFKQK
jgi:lipopolysaccharide/colanic/teichoic acid biosynthesis glycosyltransferase